MDRIPDRNTPGLAELATGLTMEWLDGGQILAFTLEKVSRCTIDCYIDTYIEVMQTWPVEERARVLHDLSGREIALTPYFRKRLDDAQTTIVELGLAGVSAVVLPRGIMGQIIIPFGRLLGQKTPLFPSCHFLDRSKALAFLQADFGHIS